MKNLIRRYIYSSARHAGFYRVLWHPLTRLAALAYREHYRDSLRGNGQTSLDVKTLSPDLRVLHGPFAGMVYPTADSTGSTLHAKLLGCYEQELHPFIEQAIANPADGVVDVGCAEGYYAVGMAMRTPSSKIYAYDTEARAHELCRAMAAANGVADRVTLGQFCNAAELIRLASTGRLLVISDCEGYEGTLFTDEVCQALRHCTLIIEIHDFLRPDTSALLLPRVSRHHHVKRIRTVPDPVRPQVFHYAELDALDDAARIEAMSEQRPLPMEWFICTPREAGAAQV